MDSKSLVICDEESEYAAKLAIFLTGKKELAFQVKLCSSLRQVMALQEGVELLLIGDSFSIEEREQLKASKVFVLTHKINSPVGHGETAIFKYQSGEEILAQIIKACIAEEKTEHFWHVTKSHKGKIIGVYSPIRRIGQTMFALKKGKEIARKENVLYINLETFAGIEGYFPLEEERTLSTLLYYAKQESGQLGLILSTLVKSVEGLDYVPPAVITEDIKSVTVKEWKCLFRQILEESIYDIVLLDLGECIQGIYDILDSCDIVYVPVANDKTAVSKLRQFEEILRRLGYENLCGRMIRCDTGRTTSY